MAPNDGRNYPGIILLHGSEGGGFPTWKIAAPQLAAEGYAVLAYPYFGASDGLVGPRQILSGVEIEDLLGALTWLKNSPQVSGKKVGLAGSSRGGELALLAGSLAFKYLKDSAPDAIAVHSPGHKVWGSWSWDWVDPRCWFGAVPTYQDFPLDSTKFNWNSSCGPNPAELSDTQKDAWLWRGTPLKEGTRVEFENIKCPVFISQGMKDSVWPASQSLEIEQRLLQIGTPVETAYYENGDHWLNLDESYDRLCKVLSFYKRTLS